MPVFLEQLFLLFDNIFEFFGIFLQFFTLDCKLIQVVLDFVVLGKGRFPKVEGWYVLVEVRGRGCRLVLRACDQQILLL